MIIIVIDLLPIRYNLFMFCVYWERINLTRVHNTQTIFIIKDTNDFIKHKLLLTKKRRRKRAEKLLFFILFASFFFGYLFNSAPQEFLMFCCRFHTSFPLFTKHLSITDINNCFFRNSIRKFIISFLFNQIWKLHLYYFILPFNLGRKCSSESETCKNTYNGRSIKNLKGTFRHKQFTIGRTNTRDGFPKWSTTESD